MLGIPILKSVQKGGGNEEFYLTLEKDSAQKKKKKLSQEEDPFLVRREPLRGGKNSLRNQKIPGSPS